jgi:hypothetical protein
MPESFIGRIPLSSTVSPPSSTAALAIVQWTHTLVMKPMLLRAREQILRSSFAEHHVVLSSCGQSEPCSTLLKRAEPLVVNVTCSTAEEVARELPAFSNLRTVFDGRGHHLNVGQSQWCWHSCDAPYLLWYSRIGRKLRHVQFFWFLEWDVVWTGDVTTILSAWSAIHEPVDIRERGLNLANPTRLVSRTNRTDVYALDGRPIHSHDLLCPNPGYAPRNWAHRHKRDERLVDADHVHRCVTEIFRLTPRLLQSMVRFSKQLQGSMFCEMRAPSVCGMEAWCTMRSLFDRERLHLFFTGTRRTKNGSLLIADLRGPSAASPSLSEVQRARAEWVATYIRATGGVQDAQLQKLDRPMLFHAYKWNPTCASDECRNLAALNLTFAKRLVQLTRPFAERLSNEQALEPRRRPGSAPTRRRPRRMSSSRWPPS